MSNYQFNVTKWLTNKPNTTNTKVSSIFGSNSSSSSSSSSSSNSSTAGAASSTLGQIVAYVMTIAIIIVVILLFINYFITPIFKLKPGNPGIIPIPGFDDGKLYWPANVTPGPILNKDLPIASQYYGYTINLDVFIENPLQFATTPRLFFSRGAVLKEKPSGDTILGLLDNYNLVAGLLPDTNDLIVSVLNKDNNQENVIVTNVLVQEPFRITMVVMQQALEVYINGKLLKTRKFLSEPKDVKGDIYPTTGILNNAIKVQNLKIWNRILTVSEIREATPSLSSVAQFGGGNMPSSITIASERLSKLTV